MAEAAHPSDLRKAMRIAVQEKIFLNLAQSRTEEATVQNVSESGAYLLTHSSLPSMASVRMTFTLDFGRKKKLCLLYGRVVRRQLPTDTGSRSYGYGVRFDGAQKEAIQVLSDFIFYKETGKVPPHGENSKPAHEISVRFGKRS
jgi:hypothetical protein